MKTKNKTFAPFGDVLHLLRSNKIQFKFALFFFCGRYAYKEAKEVIEGGQFALCLPFGQSLENFSWPIADMRLVLYDTGDMSLVNLKKIAYGLLELKVNLVAIHSPDHKCKDIFTF